METTDQEPTMSTTTCTTLILTAGDLADVASQASRPMARDEHGIHRDIPALDRAQIQSLADGQIVQVDGMRLIHPRWPENVRETTLGARPAEIVAAELGIANPHPETMLKIGALAERGAYDGTDIAAPGPQMLAVIAALREGER